MKKLFFFLLILISGPTYSSNWIKSGSLDEGVSYYDKDSVVKNKNIVSYWGKIDYKKMQLQNDVAYNSWMTEIRIDCSNRLIYVVTGIPQLNGNNIRQINFKDNWTSIIPDTPVDSQFKILCK